MIPFDQDHSDAIVECVRLASLEQLGIELARRCADACIAAATAKEVARTSDDLVAIGEAAALAHHAAELCGHLSSAVCSLLGSADSETVKRCFAEAREASTHAMLAATRWTLMRERRGCANA